MGERARPKWAPRPSTALRGRPPLPKRRFGAVTHCSSRAISSGAARQEPPTPDRPLGRDEAGSRWRRLRLAQRLAHGFFLLHCAFRCLPHAFRTPSAHAFRTRRPRMPSARLMHAISPNHLALLHAISPNHLASASERTSRAEPPRLAASSSSVADALATRHWPAATSCLSRSMGHAL